VALMLACVWGGTRHGWTSPTIVALLAGAVVLGWLFVARERRAADPLVPLALLRMRTVAIVSVGLFLTTAALFAVTVFVPLFLQTTTAATPTQTGLLLVPMMLGITVSTFLAGRAIARTGRYKAIPVAGLAVMSAALVLLAVIAGHPSRVATAGGLAVFGLGFGVVGQVLTVAVQNEVDRRQLGVAMATTMFFRGLGGAIGAAAFGALFAGRVGRAATRAEVIDGVQVVLVVAAAIALAGLLVVLLLREHALPDARRDAVRA
jgi:predicted MFS family arabinose efflux permease